jgi:N-methylhydantoinase A
LIKYRAVGLGVGIDIGGTFTDMVVVAEDGEITSHKTPTTPAEPLDGLLAGVETAAAERGFDAAGFLALVDRLAHGTTAATNAFIERRGARIALLTTRGFEDTVFMQRMLGMTAGLSPAELTDYSLRRVPAPLCPRSLVFGIRERVDYAGRAVGRLREDDVGAAAAAIREAGAEAVAIAFLWSFKNPEHEHRAAEIVRAELPGAYVSVSSDLVPRIGEYERTATTLVNAYLGPAMSRYAEALERRLAGTNVVLLDSNGGVMTPAEAGRAPVRLLLSGPSGGVTASRHLAAELGHADVITFDMGGTSTDVGLIVGGEAVRRHETVAEQYHLLLPMVDVRAIGAGGGSIARVEEGGYLRVGPESAGADPGPACYGRGGERPTVTDADLVLGILDPDYFLGGRLPLDVDAARAAIVRHVAGPLRLPVEEAAAGIREIVDARMADLLRTVTVEQGHDPRQFVLYAFGGAGPTHAPAFSLDVVDEVLVPATQSVHSALGAIASDVTLTVELSVPIRLSRTGGGAEADADELEAVFRGLEAQARARLDAQGIPEERRELDRLVEVRFTRQTKTLAVAYRGAVAGVLEDFLRAYAARYSAGAVPEAAGFELVTFAVRARGRLRRPAFARYETAGEDPSRAARGRRAAYDPGRHAFVDTPIFDGPALRPGNRLSGPAIAEYPGTTVVVGSGQEAHVDALLGISIGRTA